MLTDVKVVNVELQDSGLEKIKQMVITSIAQNDFDSALFGIEVITAQITPKEND